MKRFCFILILVIHALFAGATRQFDEVITINDSIYQLSNLLLEDEPNFQKLQQRLPKETCTALGRNYIGHWKIQNDSLFLDSVCTFVDGKIKAIKIDDIYHQYKTPTGYFASWVNSPLSVLHGKAIIFEFSIFEYNDMYNVKNGIAQFMRSENAKIALEPPSYPDALTLIETFPFHKFPNIKTNILVNGFYDEFDQNGTPTHCHIDLKSRTNIDIDESEKAALKEEISKFVIDNKLFPLYIIGNKPIKVFYSYPFRFNKYNNVN